MRLQVFPVLVMLLLACGKAADSTPDVSRGPIIPDGRDPAALVTALDSSTMAAMEQRSGTWNEADATSEWRARLTGGKVRVVDERMTVGESSSRRITHYYTDEGKLAAFIEFRIQTVSGSDRPPSKQFVLMKLEFRGDSTTRSEKTVDGEVAPVLDFEITNARKHSMDLLSAAQSAASTAPGKS